MDEQRIREIVREEIAAAATTAIWDDQLSLIEARKRRVEQRVTDPIVRQRILTALEAQRCSLQSFLQQQE